MRCSRITHLKTQSAFTLLEVLVALAVLAMGMGTVIKVVTSQSIQVGYLKEKTIAQWVASNKANEVQLAAWPATGTSRGSEFMAQQEWRWKLTVSNTPDKDIRRLDIEVSRADEKGEPVVRFIAFKGHQDEQKKNISP
jgi:general secretion pathway protein I